MLDKAAEAGREGNSAELKDVMLGAAIAEHEVCKQN